MTGVGVVRLALDAARHLDLVEEWGITRTPTVLLLDGEGVVRNRSVGAPRAADVRDALAEDFPADERRTA